MAKGKETKRRIVQEAAAIFNQHGYEGGSMSALMEATGLEKGGIYRHFSSKEELAAQAFDYAWDAAVETRMRDLDLIPNSVDRLKAFITNFAERRSPIPGGCPLLNTAIEADDGNPVLRERARKALTGWRNRLVTIIQEGLAKREMKSSVDAKKLANLIISSLEGALMISRLEKSSKALADVGSHLKAYLDAEVRTHKS
ncbi:MAG TPA: TetR/AcrR family transcriptional regulator [Terriglobales bacterium]|nr:TetR/AcrR family transcriptional regulator [Terriglobales bacterium]